MKREGLEEAKVFKKADKNQDPEPLCQSLSLSSDNIPASTSLNDVLLRGLARRLNVTMTSTPIHPSNTGVFEAQLISAFWDCYIPSRTNAQSGSPCYWLQQTICLQDPPLALRLSLVALAMTRLGWLQGDDAMVRRGRAVYGHALRELQKALSNEYSRCQDETMATCTVLALYEVSNSPVNPVHCFSLDLYSSPNRHLAHVWGILVT